MRDLRDVDNARMQRRDTVTGLRAQRRQGRRGVCVEGRWGVVVVVVGGGVESVVEVEVVLVEEVGGEMNTVG